MKASRKIQNEQAVKVQAAVIDEMTRFNSAVNRGATVTLTTFSLRMFLLSGGIPPNINNRGADVMTAHGRI